MKVINDMSLNNFQYWAGAGYTFEVLDSHQIGEIEGILEELYPDGMTETEVNDFFWFERDTIADWLGFESWEDLKEFNEQSND